MNNFQKRTAARIALVSILLACIASPIAWFVQRENSEEAIVELANEEAGRLLHRYDAFNLSGPDAVAHATTAAQVISGGMFDLVEISDFLIRPESIWHGESLVVTLWEGWQARIRGCRRSYKCQSYS